MRITVAVAALSLSIISLSATAQALAAVNREPTDIPAQELAPALRALARDRNFQIVFATKDVSSRYTHGAVGELTTDEALTQILSGTGLTYHYLDDRTVSILPVNAKMPAQEHAESSSSATPEADGAKGVRKDASNSFRLAQEARGASTEPSSVEKANDEQASQPKPVQLEEVTVTGTLIPGATPASPVIVIDRAAIDRSGYATIGDVIRNLPQSFGGAQNPGVNGTGQANAANNYGQASTANLRGLGPDATLTLVNGHRLAFNGVSDSVDISAIPLAAVERIEILTDGASAIYGSDAVAGVVNVIMKPDYDGAETALRYGDSTDGAGSSRQFEQTVGLSGGRGGFILTYEHFDQDRLLASERSFSSQTYNPTSLIPADTRDTAFFSGHLDLSSSISLFADALFTHRDPDVLTTDVIPGYGSLFIELITPVNQSGTAAGLRIALPRGWNASVTVTSARDAEVDTETISGEPPETYSFENKTVSGEVAAAGPLASLWSGPLAVALSAGYRREETDVSLDGLTSASRNIKYGAAELNIPLVAEDLSRPALHRLELSAAARYEQYSDFGDATNPKFGLLYVPLAGLTLKGTWGRSFHAPGLWEKYGGQFTLAEDAPDFGENEPGKVGLEGSGANPALGAETAHDWTASIDYKPSWLSGATATVSAYGIDYRNRITSPISSAVGILGNPLYTPFIVTNPSASLVANVTNPPYVLYNYSGAQTFSASNVYAYYQGYYQNVTRQTVSGVDILLDYRLNTAIGVFDPSLDVTHINLDQYSTPTAPRTTLSGTIFNIPSDRARAGLTWTQGPWGMSGFLNYISSEIDNTGTFLYGATVFHGHVGSWTTVDAQLTYDVHTRSSIFDNLKIALSAQNLLDRAPPAVPYTSTEGEYAGLGFDPANASALGRFLSIAITKKF